MAGAGGRTCGIGKENRGSIELSMAERISKQRTKRQARRWQRKVEQFRERQRQIEASATDILNSRNFRRTKGYIQHGNMTVNAHVMNVARYSIALSENLHIPCNRRELIRGALLHDYFLYDWHIKEPFRKAHGFSHAAVALQNAERDFQLNAVERDMIVKHMFPLNLTPPRYRESILVCIADKICAVYETFSIPIPKNVLQVGQI